AKVQLGLSDPVELGRSTAKAGAAEDNAAEGDGSPPRSITRTGSAIGYPPAFGSLAHLAEVGQRYSRFHPFFAVTASERGARAMRLSPNERRARRSAWRSAGSHGAPTPARPRVTGLGPQNLVPLPPTRRSR